MIDWALGILDLEKTYNEYLGKMGIFFLLLDKRVEV